MSDPFDPQSYESLPQSDAAGTLALATAMIQAAPANPSNGVARAVARLRSVRDGLQAALDEDGKNPERPATHAADHRVDLAWRSLDGRLEHYANLPAASNPRAPRAAELRRLLFTNGYGFLGAKFLTEWAESDAILRRIDTQHLQADIDALAGPEFLAEVRQAHLLYGNALGVTAQQAAKLEVNVVDPLKAVREELQKYARALAAYADEDPGRVEDIRKAFLPVDALRERHAGARPAGKPATPPTPAG